MAAAPDVVDTRTDALGSWADTDTHTCSVVIATRADRTTGHAGHDSVMKPLKRVNSIEACDTPTGTAAPDVLLPSARPRPLFDRVLISIHVPCMGWRGEKFLPGAEYGPGPDAPYGLWWA